MGKGDRGRGSEGVSRGANDCHCNGHQQNSREGDGHRERNRQRLVLESDVKGDGR